MELNQEIVDYIKARKEQGLGVDEITNELKGAGWSEQEINIAAQRTFQEVVQKKKQESTLEDNNFEKTEGAIISVEGSNNTTLPKSLNKGVFYATGILLYLCLSVFMWRVIYVKDISFFWFSPLVVAIIVGFITNFLHPKQKIKTLLMMVGIAGIVIFLNASTTSSFMYTFFWIFRDLGLIVPIIISIVSILILNKLIFNTYSWKKVIRNSFLACFLFLLLGVMTYSIMYLLKWGTKNMLYLIISIEWFGVVAFSLLDELSKRK